MNEASVLAYVESVEAVSRSIALRKRTLEEKNARQRQTLSERDQALLEQRGGFLGAVVVVGLLAKYKDDFNKCAPGGAAFATKFTWKGSKTTDAQVTASSEPKQEACVAAVLKSIKPSTVEGTCTAIVLTGKTAKAEAAAEALRKKQ